MPPYSSSAKRTCPLEDRIRFFEPVASAIYHEQARGGNGVLVGAQGFGSSLLAF